MQNTGSLSVLKMTYDKNKAAQGGEQGPVSRDVLKVVCCELIKQLPGVVFTAGVAEDERQDGLPGWGRILVGGGVDDTDNLSNPALAAAALSS